MKRKFNINLYISLSLLLLNSVFSSQAHTVAQGSMGIYIEDDAVNISYTPYVTAFNFADKNQDQLLSLNEIETHREQIYSQLKKMVTLTNEEGLKTPEPHITLKMPKPDAVEAEYLHFEIDYEWSHTPRLIDITYRNFSPQPPNIKKDYVDYLIYDSYYGKTLFGNFPLHQDNKFRMRDGINNQPLERLSNQTVSTAIIASDQDATSSPPIVATQNIEVNKTTSASQSILQRVWSINNVWVLGVKHVLEGYDHILFIITLVLANASLRRIWLPLTVFTLTHTLALAFVIFGFAPPLPDWSIETLIAASITLLAFSFLTNIKMVHHWIFIALIGLIHGFGFGQALGTSLGNLRQWGQALISITIGIELTHMLIAAMTLLVLYLISKIKPLYLVPHFVGAAILGISLFWTVERIPF